MPVVTRDSALSVGWLTGGQGRETLQMMGVPDDRIVPASLAEEAARIASFLDKRLCRGDQGWAGKSLPRKARTPTSSILLRMADLGPAHARRSWCPRRPSRQAGYERS